MTRENMRNKQYTDEFKESILKRLEQNETVGSLSIELNISKSTIYQRIRTNNKKQKNTIISLKSKDTASLTEEELAEYCRRKGLYMDEIKVGKNNA